MKIERISKDIFNLAQKVYDELGGGFPEPILQNALAIELREAKIKYLKEVNIEIFYKEQSIGTDRPDFVLLTPGKSSWDLKSAIILETKWSNRFKNDNRMQLKSYFKSFPRNKNSALHKIRNGILLRFLKTEDFEEGKQSNQEIELEFWEYNKGSGSMKLKYVLPLKDE